MGFAYNTWGKSWGTSWGNSWGISTAVDTITGRGHYTYSPSHIKYQSEETQRKIIAQEKTELQKLESVLRETERKKELATQSRLEAEKRKNRQRAIELEKSENEYLTEINRLLMVKAELMQRLRQSEEILIAIIAMRRKRLRVGNWQVN